MECRVMARTVGIEMHEVRDVCVAANVGCCYGMQRAGEPLRTAREWPPVEQMAGRL